MTDILQDKMACLLKYGVPRNALAILTAGGMYFEEMGGIPFREYWITDAFDNRDEFFLIANTSFSLAHLAGTLKPKNEWRLSFDVAFLFQTKANAQSIVAIEKLASANCYSDAFAICRTMHSRLNLLLLCSLNPSLFNHWLKNPKDEKFLDGHIRDELRNNGVHSMQHLYELYSEIVHNQFQALADTGYMEQGLFVDIPAIKNAIYVTAKFILAMSSYSMLSMAIIDLGSDSPSVHLQEHEVLFSFLKGKVLVPNRFDHMWTVLAEDRHWEKVGKNKYRIGDSFDFDGYREQLFKFHRVEGKRKKLSKKYNIN